MGLGPGAATLAVTSVQQCHSDSCPSILPLGPDGSSSTPAALTVVCGPQRAWPCLGRAASCHSQACRGLADPVEDGPHSHMAAGPGPLSLEVARNSYAVQ